MKFSGKRNHTDSLHALCIGSETHVILAGNISGFFDLTDSLIKLFNVSVCVYYAVHVSVWIVA